MLKFRYINSDTVIRRPEEIFTNANYLKLTRTGRCDCIGQSRTSRDAAVISRFRQHLSEGRLTEWRGWRWRFPQ